MHRRRHLLRASCASCSTFALHEEHNRSERGTQARDADGLVSGVINYSAERRAISWRSRWPRAVCGTVRGVTRLAGHRSPHADRVLTLSCENARGFEYQLAAWMS